MCKPFPNGCFMIVFSPCAIQNSPTWSPAVESTDRCRTGTTGQGASSAGCLWKWSPHRRKNPWYSHRYWKRGSHHFDQFSQPGWLIAHVEHIWEHCGLLFFSLPNHPKSNNNLWSSLLLVLSRSEVHINSWSCLPLCVCPTSLWGSWVVTTGFFLLDVSVVETTLHILDASLLPPLTPDWLCS